MAAIQGFVFSAAALAALSVAPAVAQTASSLAKPAAVSSAAASRPTPDRWICVSRTTVEIAPVSFDTVGAAEAWVMVHRMNGKVVAAERIEKREVDELRRMPCGDQGGVLVG
jgi:hypothetical protein